MSCITCELDPCICHPAQGQQPIRSTYTPMDWGLTREQFGEDLYTAIATVGKIMQLKHQRQHIAPSRIKKGQLKAWQRQESELLASLREQVKGLSDADAAAVMTRYPFVGAL